MAGKKYGIQYVWDNNEWVEFIPKASMALMEATTDRLIFYAADKELIDDYLTAFNAANKLIKLSPTGEFNSDLMYVNDDIDMNNNAINGINALRFEDEESSLFTMLNAFNIHTGTDLLKLSSADKIELVAADVEVLGGLTVSGSTNMKGAINLTGSSASNRQINGVHTINFVDSMGDASISAIQNGEVYDLDFTWGDGSRNLSLSGTVADFNGTRLSGLLRPSADDDAATKGWVNEMIAQGTHVVAAARVATTGEIDIDDSGLINAIDDVTLEAGDRVLVWKQETNPTENGVYEVNEGIQKWTKIDIDSDKGSLIFITEGTANKSKQFYMNGTTWELFFTQKSYYADPTGGLKLDGLNFSIKNLGVTNAMLEGSISAGKLLKTSTFTVAPDNSLAIADESITNDMLYGSITWDKLLPKSIGYTASNSWAAISTPGDSAKSLTLHLTELNSAIRLLRGTDELNTPNNETIAGAYTEATSRSKVFYIAAGAQKPLAAAVGTLAAGMTAVLYQEVEPEE